MSVPALLGLGSFRQLDPMQLSTEQRCNGRQDTRWVRVKVVEGLSAWLRRTHPATGKVIASIKRSELICTRKTLPKKVSVPTSLKGKLWYAIALRRRDV